MLRLKGAMRKRRLKRGTEAANPSARRVR